MKKIIAFLCLVVAVGVVGCVDRTGMNQEELAYSLDLPPSAENVKLLDLPMGAWHTFELNVDGQKRRYLRHYTTGDAGTEALVEIIPR